MNPSAEQPRIPQTPRKPDPSLPGVVGASTWHVFAEDGTLGNNALVYLCSQPISHLHRQQLATATPQTTHCFVWQETTSQFRCHCHNAQTEIQRCGHGYLAATAHLFEHQQPPLSTSTPLQLLCSDGTPLNAWNSPPSYRMVELPCLPNRATPLPDWLTHAFTVLPISAAVAGEETGYWIFEWPPGTDLHTLQVNIAAIAQHTQRAVIATAQAGPGTGYDFCLRYFAPQYGSPEDGVTGSANAVLAIYWAERSNQQSFRALQCSATGGVVYSQLTATGVAIGGRVTTCHS